MRFLRSSRSDFAPLEISCDLRWAMHAFAVRYLWRQNDRPHSMFQRGRAAQDDIEDAESFYYRVFSNHMRDNQLTRGQLPYPNLSVNRTKHGGKWWHVLLPDPPPAGQEDDSLRDRRLKNLCMGVVQFNIPEITCEFDGVSFRFVVEHDPCPHNYCHCEFRIYSGATPMQKADLKGVAGKKAVKHYKDDMMRNLKYILASEAQTRGA